MLLVLVLTLVSSHYETSSNKNISIYEMKKNSHLKMYFIQQSIFSIFSVLPIPIVAMRFSSGSFPAICRVCYDFCFWVFKCSQMKFETITGCLFLCNNFDRLF